MTETASIQTCQKDSLQRKKVVIVGAGFAGLHCALRLAVNTNLQITVLDKNNYQQFQPLLYQVATGILAPSNAAFNLREVLMHHANIDVQMTEIVSADLRSRTVRDKDGNSYTGDYLVLAAGAEANFFDVPGLQQFSFPMYSLRDAERLRSRLLEVLEHADSQASSGADPKPHVVVIGAGATGVELAGALADIFDRTSLQYFRHLNLRSASVTLIDREEQILKGFTEKSQNYARETLEKRGVKIRTGVSVLDVTESKMGLSDGSRLSYDVVAWAGGLRSACLSASLSIEPTKGGRIDVQPELSIADHPGVYALGDFANTKGEDGKWLPQLASVAQQAGEHCAKNILCDLKGEEQTPFTYSDKGIMAMVGRNAAIAEVGSAHQSLTGPIAFAAWLGVHAVLLTTLRAKMSAFVEWAWNYFSDVHLDAILDRREASQTASGLQDHSEQPAKLD